MKATRVRLLLLPAAALIIAACAPAPQAYGTLQGHVSIGPLVPVLRQGEIEPTPAPEVYAARQIVVFAANGSTEVARLEIDADGSYHADLPVGSYVVDINRTGIDSAAGLPRQIQIEANRTTTLDIDIDTGIR